MFVLYVVPEGFEIIIFFFSRGLNDYCLCERCIILKYVCGWDWQNPILQPLRTIYTMEKAASSSDAENVNNNNCWQKKKKKSRHFSFPCTVKVGEVVPEKPSET